MKKKETTVIERVLQFKLCTSLLPLECAKKVNRPKFWASFTFIVLTILQIVSFVEFFQSNSEPDLLEMVVLTAGSLIVTAVIFFAVGKIEIGYHVWSMGLEYLRISNNLRRHGLRRVLRETSPERVVNMIEDRLLLYAKLVMKQQAEGIDHEKVDAFKDKTFNDLFNLAKELGVKVKPYADFFPKVITLRQSPFETYQRL